MIGTDDRAIIKLYSGTLLQLFHVTWHIIIGQKGGVCTTYAINPRNLNQIIFVALRVGLHEWAFTNLSRALTSLFFAKYHMCTNLVLLLTAPGDLHLSSDLHHLSSVCAHIHRQCMATPSVLHLHLCTLEGKYTLCGYTQCILHPQNTV